MALFVESSCVLFAILFVVVFHSANLLRKPVYDHVENQFVRAMFIWFLKSSSVAKIVVEFSVIALPVFEDVLVIV